MLTPPHLSDAAVRHDPVDPGIVFVAPGTAIGSAAGALRRDPAMKATIRERAFTDAERRSARWLSPDAIVALHEAADATLAAPLPVDDAAFEALFSRHAAPRRIVAALSRARALFHAETGYWPRKIISRCNAPMYARESFHLVEYAHFDSYDDPDERFVMIVVMAGAGPVLIRNPENALPDSLETEVFAAYAQRLLRRHGAVQVAPGSIVLKKANHRGGAEFADRLPHVSGKVSRWPVLGKRVAFTLS